MMTLLDIVSSKRRAAILCLLFGLEPRDYHLRELARQSGLALRTVQEELVRLVKAGLVNSRRDGNRVCYQANRDNPVYGDLRNIVMKTAGLAGVVRDVLQGPDIEIAFLFGSLAADTARPDSDVDLMVIGPLGLRHLSRRLSGLGSKLGREINPHVMTRQEFGRRKRMGDHFVSTVLAAPRIFILGTEDELTELGT